LKEAGLGAVISLQLGRDPVVTSCALQFFPYFVEFHFFTPRPLCSPPGIFFRIFGCRSVGTYGAPLSFPCRLTCAYSVCSFLFYFSRPPGLHSYYDLSPQPLDADARLCPGFSPFEDSFNWIKPQDGFFPLVCPPLFGLVMPQEALFLLFLPVLDPLPLMLPLSPC